MKKSLIKTHKAGGSKNKKSGKRLFSNVFNKLGIVKTINSIPRIIVNPIWVTSFNNTASIGTIVYTPYNSLVTRSTGTFTLKIVSSQEPGADYPGELHIYSNNIPSLAGAGDAILSLGTSQFNGSSGIYVFFGLKVTAGTSGTSTATRVIVIDPFTNIQIANFLLNASIA